MGAPERSPLSSVEEREKLMTGRPLAGLAVGSRAAGLLLPDGVVVPFVHLYRLVPSQNTR